MHQSNMWLVSGPKVFGMLTGVERTRTTNLPVHSPSCVFQCVHAGARRFLSATWSVHINSLILLTIARRLTTGKHTHTPWSYSSCCFIDSEMTPESLSWICCSPGLLIEKEAERPPEALRLTGNCVQNHTNPVTAASHSLNWNTRIHAYTFLTTSSDDCIVPKYSRLFLCCCYLPVTTWAAGQSSHSTQTCCCKSGGWHIR